MWISIPLNLSSRSFIPLPRFIRSHRSTPLFAPSLVLLCLFYLFIGFSTHHSFTPLKIRKFSWNNRKWTSWSYNRLWKTLSHLFLLPIESISEQPWSNGETTSHWYSGVGRNELVHKTYRSLHGSRPMDPTLELVVCTVLQSTENLYDHEELAELTSVTSR
jgi:hypothetical protein